MPYVSIVMPIRNEEHFIKGCLDSIIANDYPHNRYEIVVVDGMSTDHSIEIVKKYSQRYKNIKLFDNPKKIRVVANNIGIREAKGEIIISMDAHVLYAPDYIRQCVKLLQTTNAANVGGHQSAVGYNYVTKAIALTLTTPFGIGNAEFRYLNEEKCIDTVYLGAWFKKTLEDVGFFNENWGRAGDYELNYRIRQKGGKILLSPKIKCHYFVRSSLLKLAKQYFLHGIWRLKTILTHPDSIRWRNLLPPLLIIWLLLSPILLAFGFKLWWIPISIYTFYTVITSLLISTIKGIIYFPILIPITWVLHISWGVGFWFGSFRFGVPKIQIKTILKDLFGKSNNISSNSKL